MEGGHVVYRDGEETLDLAGVEVDGQEPVGPRRGDHVGDQSCGDGHPWFVLLVGPAVGVVGNHRRDPSRGVPPEGVHEDEELHDVLVDRRGGGLDQEHVLGTHALLKANEDVLIGKLKDIRLAERNFEIVGDLSCQTRVSRA